MEGTRGGAATALLDGFATRFQLGSIVDDELDELVAAELTGPRGDAGGGAVFFAVG